MQEEEKTGDGPLTSKELEQDRAASDIPYREEEGEDSERESGGDETGSGSGQPVPGTPGVLLPPD
jgi:hypothetical protein